MYLPLHSLVKSNRIWDAADVSSDAGILVDYNEVDYHEVDYQVLVEQSHAHRCDQAAATVKCCTHADPRGLCNSAMCAHCPTLLSILEHCCI